MAKEVGTVERMVGRRGLLAFYDCHRTPNLTIAQLVEIRSRYPDAATFTFGDSQVLSDALLTFNPIELIADENSQGSR